MLCKNCNKSLVPAKTRKGIGEKTYCDNRCQQEYQGKIRYRDFKGGQYVGKLIQYRTGEWTRRLLIEEFGYSCATCGGMEWNGHQLVLEVNHIDGDAKNNVLINLEFLCPNCHSLTSTYRAKNKNCTREPRRSKEM